MPRNCVVHSDLWKCNENPVASLRGPLWFDGGSVRREVLWGRDSFLYRFETMSCSRWMVRLVQLFASESSAVFPNFSPVQRTSDCFLTTWNNFPIALKCFYYCICSVWFYLRTYRANGQNSKLHQPQSNQWRPSLFGAQICGRRFRQTERIGFCVPTRMPYNLWSYHDL